MRVLVVEDHQELAEAVAAGLRREDMAVDLSFDGDSALDRASWTDYDVIVLDRDLPGTHGDEVCTALLAAGIRGRILMLTAYPSREEGGADLVAMRARQVPVEDDDVVVGPAGPVQCAVTVEGQVDGHVFAPQACRDRLGQLLVVLDHEYSHRRPPEPATTASDAWSRVSSGSVLGAYRGHAMAVCCRPAGYSKVTAFVPTA